MVFLISREFDVRLIKWISKIRWKNLLEVVNFLKEKLRYMKNFYMEVLRDNFLCVIGVSVVCVFSV